MNAECDEAERQNHNLQNHPNMLASFKSRELSYFRNLVTYHRYSFWLDNTLEELEIQVKIMQALRL
jgi:hypothetical protein